MEKSIAAHNERFLKRLSKQLSAEGVSTDQLGPLCSFFEESYADQPIARAFQDRNTILRRWKWLNREHPLLLENETSAWICLKRGQIVGHFATLPSLLIDHGQEIPICWGRDLIVAPKARMGGVGPFLILSVLNAVQRPMVVAGLNERSYAIFLRLGFKDLGKIPLFIKVYQPTRLLETLPWPWLSRKVAAVLIASKSRVIKLQPKQKTSLTFTLLNQFSHEFDPWWKSIEKQFSTVVRRTSALMNWRYKAHPTHDYKIIAAMDGTRFRGIAVVRYGHSRGVPAGFITELLAHPDDREALRGLLNHAEHILMVSTPEPLVFVRFVVLHRPLERALTEAGFFRAPSPLHWMIRGAQGLSQSNLSADHNEWFLNGGDSDLDVI